MSTRDTEDNPAHGRLATQEGAGGRDRFSIHELARTWAALFARLAVADDGLRGRPSQAKVEPSCGNAQAFGEPASVPRREAHQ